MKIKKNKKKEKRPDDRTGGGRITDKLILILVFVKLVHDMVIQFFPGLYTQ